MPDLSKLSRLARLLTSRRGEDAVLSVGVQARLAQAPRVQRQFEVLIRHLYDRLLNNEAFGEDAALRVTQLAYAIVLPGIVAAMFLFPAYHGLPPHPIERPFWSQAADHLFYVTYALVILGAVILFQWDLLFPDLLDVFVLSPLPIPRARLLLGRVSALAVFLGLVVVGTTVPTDLFFPAVADLHCGFWRHFAAHTIAVTAGALFAVVLFVALGGVLACLPGRRLYSVLAPSARTVSLVLLLTILFLFPLTARYLPVLLGSGRDPATRAALLYPPFWFLGLYHVLLYGSEAQPVFDQLARAGVVITAALSAVAALAYPLAYTRRVRQLIEGATAKRSSRHVRDAAEQVLQATVVRCPRVRASFHFVAQTLSRMARLHLYMAMYAGLGLALLASGLVAFVVEGGHLHVAVSAFGVRSAVPVLVFFWIVAGLRTALLSPIGIRGSWVFRVITGQPQLEDLLGAEIFVRCIAILLTLGCVAVLFPFRPPELRTAVATCGQILVTIGLSVTLTDMFFLPVRTIPFSASRPSSTRDLPFTLVRYLVVFPAFVLAVVSYEPWIEASAGRLLCTVLGFVSVHAVLRHVRGLLLRQREPGTEESFTVLKLRED